MSKILLLKLVDMCAAAQQGMRGSTGSDWWQVGSTRGTWAEQAAALRVAASIRLHHHGAHCATEHNHLTTAVCAGPSQGSEPQGHDLEGPRQCAPINVHATIHTLGF